MGRRAGGRDGRRVLLCSCRFIPTADVQALARRKRRNGARFDPDKMVASIWTAKVVPYFEKKAGPFAEVRDLAAKSPDEAGAKFGYRPKSGDAPWTFMVKLEGVIVEANTEFARRDHRRRHDRQGQGGRDRSDRPGDARHRDPRRARLRLLQRFHQPDRFRPLWQGVQHLRRP